MKRLLNIFLIVLLLFSGSCSDYLDITPSGLKTDDIIWTSRTEVEGYLANIYAAIPMPQLHQDDPWEGCSDETDLSWTVYLTYGMNFGNWAEGIEYYNKYSSWYTAIRQSFVLENNIDRCAEIPVELRTQYKAEAKFLRGYYFWMLLRQYGPLVLVKEELKFDGDFTQYTRAPYDECVDYICQMMDEAERDLPLHWWDDTGNLGRPNQIVCKSVKAIVLHHAASPQFNGGNPEYANFKNPDGTQLISTTYDENKWKRAAQAAKAVIDIADKNPAILRLYKNTTDGGDPAFNPYKSCIDVQLVKWNRETIFARSRGNSLRGWMIHTTPGPSCLGGVGPTQRLVDAFLMKNGKPIDYPGSGYVETGWTTTGGDNWNPQGHNIGTETGRKDILTDIRNSEAWGHWADEWNMYANREPRFYAAIMYNKRVIPQIPLDVDKRDFYNSVGQRNGLGRVELYYGGVSRQSGSYTFFSRTGYLAYKRVDPLCEMGNESERKWPQDYAEVFIRYATIILNYIEALNQYDPGNSDIRKYWDMIRERAGVPSAFIATPDIIGNRDLQHEYIIRERMVELCFEGDRYFTTRRLMLADKKDNAMPAGKERYGDGEYMYGMNVNAGNASTNDFSYLGFYTRTPFEKRVFMRSFYLFPIPKVEVDNSEGRIVQNPGWR